MKERPILFSAPMIRALLAGKKTQTRRIITPQPHRVAEHFEALRSSVTGEVTNVRVPDGWAWRELYCADGNGFESALAKHCPYGSRADDRLWVRETWASVPWLSGAEFRVGEEGIRYRATWNKVHRDRWRPSIFLRRAASRITLKVTSVRVERLQDISEVDAIAEGCAVQDPSHHTCARDEFSALWERINGKRAPWASNPWLWVVGFEVAR
jgi:hypothetical protein